MHRTIRGAALVSGSLGRTLPLLALCIATSCVLRPPSLTAGIASLPSVGGPPPDPASAPTDDNQVIDAGCSLSGNDIKGEPGSLHELSCPAGCDKEPYVVGTDIYAGHSPVCGAAIHVGAISARGGRTTLMLETGRRAYRGSKRNGIETHDWGDYRGSFRFPGVVAAPPPGPPVATGPTLIEAGCSFSANEIHGEPGTIYRVTCPAGCNAEKPLIWGSDPYTGASPVCVAAIHAGLATDRGGDFLMILESGRPAYRGSKHNGVQSNDHGAYHRSYRFQH